jgi:phosphoenolpyruvate carboxylase
MATQHPDNASAPFWHTCPPEAHGCEYISAADEIEECFRSFGDLGCEEYMWDWEGKFVDEEVVDRLFTKYLDYFQQHQLGREKFLTFRVPNIWREDTTRIPRAFMTILTANESAERLGLNTPPVFEVILPQTEDAPELIYMQEKFQETAQSYRRIFESTCHMEYFSIIPLIETTGELIHSKKLLLDYLEDFKNAFHCTVDYLRPFIARSDPALDAGFIPATIAAKAAASEYYALERETGVKVYPIMGSGSLHFRGGLSPRSIESVLRTYPGMRTLTVQSAFRYDYPLNEVKQAIEELNRKLPDQKWTEDASLEVAVAEEMNELFGHCYHEAFGDITPFIIDVAKLLPERRERLAFSGPRGYGRQMAGIEAQLPRAITFTAVFYSLGVPPEFIGTGRGIRKLREEGRLELLERIYGDLKKHLVEAGNFLNKKNLQTLTSRFKGFGLIREDIAILEESLGKELGPTDEDGLRHRQQTEKILELLSEKEQVLPYILEAARIRKSLG